MHLEFIIMLFYHINNLNKFVAIPLFTENADIFAFSKVSNCNFFSRPPA